jgi:sugar (pentulose or hexulose) kinase
MRAKIPVIAIFDIGKTNKKLLIFDSSYQVIKEESARFGEISDDDGFPCEDLDGLAAWVVHKFEELKSSAEWLLKAVNFTTYGASLVHIDEQGKSVGFLYNYLKPYPEPLMARFIEERGSAWQFSMATCSPLMGHLNAGLQLYWIKKEKPALFKRIAATLHFPQYLSFLLTGKKFAEMTNVGCHSAMWDFGKKQYHAWLREEGIQSKLSDITPGNHAVKVWNQASGEDIAVGIGLHDSSAAIIPYQQSFTDPFVILSTGTWTISLNPFNESLPDNEELSKGCLSYFSYNGKPVKASMLFAGNDHDQQVRRIAGYFNVSGDFFKTAVPDDELVRRLSLRDPQDSLWTAAPALTSAITPCAFHLRSLRDFHSAGEAYHYLVADIIDQQKISSAMVLQGDPVRQIYVDGGFCRNALYMQLLANKFSGKKVHSASIVQGTALGAAIAVHQHWNKQPIRADLIQLKTWQPNAGKPPDQKII